MQDRPEGVSEDELRLALARGWNLRPGQLRYAPAGAGGYHWVARAADGGRWFVTVDDLDAKSWLGTTQEDVYAGLRAALDTARWLRDRAGLGFVAAPEPAMDGTAAARVNSRYSVSLSRFIEGSGWEFGDRLPVPVRDRLVDMLVALHQVTPTSRVPVARPGLAERAVLAAALGDLGRPWSGGPFAEPARALLASAAGPVGDLLASFDRQAARLAASPGQVITHGEPHPGNLMHTRDGLRLIDWDTVGLAVPERDLWEVLGTSDGGVDGAGGARTRPAATPGPPATPSTRTGSAFTRTAGPWTTSPPSPAGCGPGTAPPPTPKPPGRPWSRR